MNIGISHKRAQPPQPAKIIINVRINRKQKHKASDNKESL